jgi:5-dehydro-2-deoxygluconokinase
MKRGAEGCVVLDEAAESTGKGQPVRGFPVEVLNVLGAGDAFLAGLLAGLLDGQPLADAASMGNACGALVVSRHGCTPAMPSRVELEDYLARAATLHRPDLDDRLGHMHRATTTRAPREELYVLAFDHRRQLEALAGQSGVAASRIAEFKGLIAQAVERVAERTGEAENIGVIVDERHGAGALQRLSRAGYWVARPAEIPGSRPLSLDPRDDFGLSLLVSRSITPMTRRSCGNARRSGCSRCRRIATSSGGSSCSNSSFRRRVLPLTTIQPPGP